MRYKIVCACCELEFEVPYLSNFVSCSRCGTQYMLTGIGNKELKEVRETKARLITYKTIQLV